MNTVVLESLEPLVAELRSAGFTVVGPTVRDAAIRFAEITRAAQLPAGRGDDQQPGSYRPTEREIEPIFDFIAGPDSAKRYTQRHGPRGGRGQRGAVPDAARRDRGGPRALRHRLDLPQAELCERMVRDHDPCISCSAHFPHLQLGR